MTVGGGDSGAGGGDDAASLRSPAEATSSDDTSPTGDGGDVGTGGGRDAGPAADRGVPRTAAGNGAPPPSRPPEGVAFRERQTPPAWIQPAIVVLVLPGLSIVLALIVTGDIPPLLGGAVVLGTLLPVVVVSGMSMVTEVRDDGLYVRIRPFHGRFRELQFEGIDYCRIAGPRLPYVGIRKTRSGWEYRMGGSRGVRIERDDEPALFVGSERPIELREAIERGRSSGGPRDARGSTAPGGSGPD